MLCQTLWQPGRFIETLKLIWSPAKAHQRLYFPRVSFDRNRPSLWSLTFTKIRFCILDEGGSDHGHSEPSDYSHVHFDGYHREYFYRLEVALHLESKEVHHEGGFIMIVVYINISSLSIQVPT